jgi:cell volume regulation protein A
MNPFFLIALLLIFSLIASKLSSRLGVPALLMFLGIGMMAGSDGIGSIYFDDASLTNNIGTVALAFILFYGGFSSNWQRMLPIVYRGAILATIGVILTAALVSTFAYFAMKMSLGSALLVGAIISSTDAAAVFSILQGKGIGLKGNLAPLLELESGSNDPMAIFLTITILQLVMRPDEASVTMLVIGFALQMLVGICFGIGIGKLGVMIFDRIRLDNEGLYTVLGVALVFLTYGVTDMFKGNGFLAVYICGIVMGNGKFMYKRVIGQFHNSLAWFMQISMFLILGLLVFPSQLPGVAWKGIAIALFLMFIARPLAVYICMLKSRFTFAEQTLAGWTGLRGAVPIILATFPLMEKYSEAGLLFNLVFFIVLASILIQGKTLMFVARMLNVDEIIERPPDPPLELNPESGTDNETREIPIRENYISANKQIHELKLPDEVRILLVRRGHHFLTPRGNTRINPDDVLLVYGTDKELRDAEIRLTKEVQEPDDNAESMEINVSTPQVSVE